MFWTQAGLSRRRFAIAGAAALAALGLPSRRSFAAEPLSAPEAMRRAAAGELVLIDVRSPGEWQATGVPQGARTVTIHHPGGARGFLTDILKAAGGDRTKPLALICARGNRSSRAKRFLEANGFTRVHDVPEGMFGRGARPGWLARRMPVRPCEVC